MTSRRIVLGFVLLFLILMTACTAEESADPTAMEATEPVVVNTVTSTAPPPSPTAVASDEGETGNREEPEPPPEEATVEAPTETPAPPTAETPVEATVEVEAAVNGRTDDGAYFMGRADAPVRMIDYSDFM